MMNTSIENYFPFLKNISDNLQGKISSEKIDFRKLDNPEKLPKEKKRLYDVSLEFQSLFIKTMLDAMRKTLNKENDLLYGGKVQEIFEDMLYDEYAKNYSKNADLPLAKEIYFQLEKFIQEKGEDQLSEIENVIIKQKEYLKQIEGIISTDQIQNEWYR